MYDSTPIHWLLTAATPSIRYLTLHRLLGRPEDDADAQAARREMAASGPIPAILARQIERGNWANERSYDTPRYTHPGRGRHVFVSRAQAEESKGCPGRLSRQNTPRPAAHPLTAR